MRNERVLIVEFNGDYAVAHGFPEKLAFFRDIDDALGFIKDIFEPETNAEASHEAEAPAAEHEAAIRREI